MRVPIETSKPIGIQIDGTNEALLCAIALMHEDVRKHLLAVTTPDEYLSPKGRQLFWLVQQVEERDLKPDARTLLVKLSSYPGGSPLFDQDNLEAILSVGEQSTPNLDEHIRDLKQNRVRYQIGVEETDKLQASVAKGSVPIGDVRGIVEGWAAKLQDVDAQSSSKVLDAKEVSKQYEEWWDERLASNSFFPTFFRSIDAVLAEGLAPKKVSIVAGRPGMGKSTFVLNLATRLSNRRVPVVTFALEMTKEALVQKYIAGQANIDINRIFKTEDLSSKEKQSIKVELARLATNEFFYVIDLPRLSLQQITSQIIQLQRRIGQKYCVVIIDLFGKIADIKGDALTPLYEEKLNEAQKIARDLGVHLVLVAQISRKADDGFRDEGDAKSEDKPKRKKSYRPTLGTIKNSGAFEEVADNVFLLYRAKVYDRSILEDTVEVIIAKQRMGRSNVTVQFTFDGALSMLHEKRKALVAFEEDEERELADGG